MTLKNYLASRRAEIEMQIKALKIELSEIRVAEEALSANPGSRSIVSTSRGPAVVRQGSIKDWIIRALTDNPLGLETDAVIREIVQIGGPTVERSSVTPQLSRLKSIGLIEQQGRFWKLPIQPAQEETPDGSQPSGASDDEDFLDLV